MVTETKILTQLETLDSIRLRNPKLFSLLHDLKLSFILDADWDGSIVGLQDKNLNATPSLIQLPRHLKNDRALLGRFCGMNNHVLFVDDQWIDMLGKQRDTSRLLEVVRRRFRTELDGVVLSIRFPGDQDTSAVTIPREDWARFLKTVNEQGISRAHAMENLFSTTVTPTKVIVAPIQPGTIIPDVGIYCAGPCKKIHPLILPPDSHMIRFTQELGWRNIPEIGFVCPECVTRARLKKSQRSSSSD